MTEPVEPPVPSAPPATDKPAAGKQERASWVLLIIFLIFGVIVGLIARNAPAIDKLSDPAFARGLITFVICMATIGLAFILVYQAFFAEESDDNRFRRAREIFAGLMGVLGTIVGFYFGSATTESLAPHAAALQIEATEIVSYVAGGTPPYRLTLTVEGAYADATPLKLSKMLMSEDGWVRYRFDKAVSKASVELVVTDARNMTTSRKGEFEQKDLKPAKPAEPAVTPKKQ